MTAKIPTLYALLCAVLAFVLGAVVQAATSPASRQGVPRVLVAVGGMRVEVGP